MKRLFPILLFTLSCNLDTLLLTVRCALSGRVLNAPEALAVAGVTSAVTGAALLLGGFAGAGLRGAAGYLGGGLLIAMGVWSIADGLRRPQTQETPRASGAAALGAALAVNNAAAGVAAGIGGLGAAEGAAANFAVTLLLIALGARLARRLADGRAGRYALPLSGALLVLLGALSLL